MYVSTSAGDIATVNYCSFIISTICHLKTVMATLGRCPLLCFNQIVIFPRCVENIFSKDHYLLKLVFQCVSSNAPTYLADNSAHR